MRAVTRPLRRSAILLFSVVCVCFPLGTKSYSTGAPDRACSDMVPQHGQELQAAPAPYTLTPNTTSTFGGDRIMLKLEAKENYMEGFFLQARKSEDGKPEGTFFTGVHKPFACEGAINNAVTHTSNAKLETVTVEWEAPSDFEGDVFFRGTVVKSFQTYWTDLRSEKVTIKKRSVAESPATDNTDEKASSATDEQTTVPAATKAPLTGVEASLQNLYDGCGELKSCYGPGSCVEKKNCKFMVTYTGVGGGRYEFELKGAGGGDKYVAVGLSFDEVMGDDSVVVCRSKDGSIDVSMAWNEGKDNINVVDPKKGLRTIESGELNGQLYCKFQRIEETKPKDNKVFNLKDERFHIMIAEGPLTKDNRLQYHSDRKSVSVRLVNLGETLNLEGIASGNKRLFKILHGSLMIGAWICAASCGILFARYYKQTWVKYKLCNIDQWFHNHRFFMILTWSLTIASFILIIYIEKKFETHDHALIGLASVVLCFIQPFMAALRPHPGTKNRKYFNCAHWFVGNSAQILGITAIFFGYEMLLGAGRNWVKEVAWYTLIVFIAFHCLTHVILSISQCVGDRRPKNSEVFPLKEFGGSRTLLQPDDVPMDAPHACLRKFILAFYLPVNWLFTALLILLVVVEREDLERTITEWGFHSFWNDM